MAIKYIPSEQRYTAYSSDDLTLISNQEGSKVYFTKTIQFK